MTFPRYPSYKDSDVEWLGEVPEHWAVSPCRAIVHERTAKNEGARCTDYLSLMANVGIIPYAEKGDVGNKKPEDVSKCKIVRRGDFVINSMNYGIGSYGLSDYDGVCSPVYIVLKPQNNVVESRFAFRIFENRAFQTFAQSFGNGILEHRCAINWDILKVIGVGVPPQPEQKAILAFLDRETAKIDELVAEQRRLMELLKEKRQAVISHAVTQGLNPHARMKPSGIEWVGNMPEHWEVRRVKSVSTFTTSGPRGWSDRIGEEGSLFVQSGDLNDALEIDFGGSKRVQIENDAETARTRLCDGDVVVCITGAKTGNVAVCPIVPEAAYINQHLCLIRPTQVANFKELGAKPFSVVAFHNRFLSQCRQAFAHGQYYPALTGACALGERILNYLIIGLRDYYTKHPLYKKVYQKESFDSWPIAIDVLAEWVVLTPEAITSFRSLNEKRNNALHFNPDTEINDRQLAFEAIKNIEEIISRQFSGFALLPWLLPAPGECYIKKDCEDSPFVKLVYLPNCVRLGYKHTVTRVLPWEFQDVDDYPNQEVSDEEFLRLRQEFQARR